MASDATHRALRGWTRATGGGRRSIPAGCPPVARAFPAPSTAAEAEPTLALMQRRGAGLGAVLFTDIVGSTAIAAEMGNTRWSELLERHHRTLRRSITRYGGREVDTAGDGFFVTFERPADAIR